MYKSKNQLVLLKEVIHEEDPSKVTNKSVVINTHFKWICPNLSMVVHNVAYLRSICIHVSLPSTISYLNQGTSMHGCSNL